MEEHTQDLRPAPIPAPVRRAAGRRSLIAGITVVASAYFLSLCTAIAADEGNAFESQPAQVFGTLGLVALISLGTALIISGSNARQFQRQLEPVHAYNAELAKAIDANRRLLVQHATEAREWHQELFGVCAATPGRLAVVEDRFGEVDEVKKLLEEVLSRVVRVESVVAPESGYVQGLEDGLRFNRGSQDGDKP